MDNHDLKHQPRPLKADELPYVDFEAYEAYLPTVFDQSMTMLEKLNQVIFYLHQQHYLTSAMLEKWNEVYNWVNNEGLQEAVDQTLNDWLDQGKITIDDLVSNIDDMMDKMREEFKDMQDNFQTKMDNMLEKFQDEQDTALNRVRHMLVKTQGMLYQQKQMETDLGGTTSPVFSGANHANQGMGVIKHNGKTKMFMVIRTHGDSWTLDERSRIVEFEYTSTGEAVKPTAYSHELDLGHQGIKPFCNDQGELNLLVSGSTGNHEDQSKGIAVVEWHGDDTKQAHVKTYQLFPYTDSGEPLSTFRHLTPAISPDNQFIVGAAGADFQGGTRYGFVYDFNEILNADNPLNVEPLNRFRLDKQWFTWGNVVQDVATDGTYMYIAVGSGEIGTANGLNIHTLTGRYMGGFKVDGAIGDHTVDELQGGGGIEPVRIEPEGLDILDGHILYQTTDVWNRSGARTRDGKVIHKLATDGGDPINRGFQPEDSPATIALGGNSNDISFPLGDALQISGFDEKSHVIKEAVGFHGEHSWRVYDIRSGSSQTQYTTLSPYLRDDDQYTILRADRSAANGAGLTMHTNSYGGNGTMTIIAADGDGNGDHRVHLSGNYGHFRPGNNGNQNLGSPSYHWNNVYAENGTIKTSDKREKTNIKPLSDAVLDAWAEVDYQSFQLKQAREEKGDKARHHIGVIAQQIIEAFKNHGLDAFDYGIIGYDEWHSEPDEPVYDENGDIAYIKPGHEAGNLYTIRADECLMLESALLRRSIDRLQKDIEG